MSIIVSTAKRNTPTELEWNYNGCIIDQNIVPCIDITASEMCDKSCSDKQRENIAKLKVDFDDLLPHIGEFGRYQIILFLFMIPFNFFLVFVYFTQIFITIVPEKYWCRVSELMDWPTDLRVSVAIPWDSTAENGHIYDKCNMYAVNYTQLRADGIQIADSSWPIQPCQNGWEFSFTDVPYSTIATDLGWVCDNAALPATAQAMFFVGAIVGGLLFGWMADRFGRISVIVGCNLVGFLAGVSTAFANNFWTFTICRFFLGFAYDNCFMMMYILVLEYVGPQWRTFVANMSIAVFFAFASCILPWIAYWLSNWQILAIVTSIPLLLVVFTPCLVFESARWLVSQGKIDRAVSILQRIEKINNRNVQPEMYDQFASHSTQKYKEDVENSKYSILDLFKTPRLRKITVALTLIWMATTLIFDGHIRNIGSLGLNIFTTFTIASATELPANLLLTFTLDRWGRRWYACGSMVLSGVFSLLATTVPMGLYSAILAIIGRFFVNISYSIGLQYAAELLPTVVRAQGVAFVHIMGYVATIISPYIMLLGTISPQIPLLFLGIVGIFGGMLALLLPETMDQALPQTLIDGEEFGRNQAFWSFPCFERYKKTDFV